MSIFENKFNVIYLRVVQGCNLNCDHCFTLGNLDPIKNTKLELIEDFIFSIKKNVNPEKAVFYIHGGETFLAPLNHLKEVNTIIKKYFSDTKIDIIPQTNLIYSINDEFINFIKTEYRGTMGVSWDADIRFGSVNKKTKEHQEKLFFKNLKKLLNSGIKIHIAITAQKNLLNYDPIDVAKKFSGVDSIDFELLTIFDDKSKNLKMNNEKWSIWFDKLVEYYQHNKTSWCLPQVDLFTKSLIEGKILNCKCNCCDERTFTLNPNGTVGLCPDQTYVAPFSTVLEMKNDWKLFEKKSIDIVLNKKVKNSSHPMCYECEHYDVCGGNCEISLFDDTEECPLSKRMVSRVRNNQEVFKKLYINKGKVNLTELRENYEKNNM